MNRTEHIREAVRKLYESRNPDADPWTDWGYPNHVLVVARHAEKLAQATRANLEFALAGALLHDIADAVTHRGDPKHDEMSADIARDILEKSGFEHEEIETILHEVIEPHSCREKLPKTVEGQILATADAMAHFSSDFYLYFAWKHYGGAGNAHSFEDFKHWALGKIEREFQTKIFFDEAREEIMKDYEALKLLFGR